MKRGKLWYYIFSLLDTFLLVALAQLIYPHIPADYQAALVLTAAQAGPLVAVVLVCIFSKDWTLWERMNWKQPGRGGFWMMFISFSLPAAIVLSGALILSLAGARYVPSGLTGISATVTLIASILGCVFEEIGWRGYLLPAFMKERSLFLSGAFTGLLWGAWHVTKLMIVGPAGYLMFVVFIAELSVIMAGIYAKTNGNMFSMVLFHLGVNVASLFMLTEREGIPFYVSCIGVATIVCAVVVLMGRGTYFTRKAETITRQSMGQ